MLVLGGFVAAIRAAGSGSSSDSASSSADTTASASADAGAESATATPEAAQGSTPLDLGSRSDAAAALDAFELEQAARATDNSQGRSEQQFESDSAALLGGACPLPPDSLPGSGPWQVVAIVQLPSGPATVLTETSGTDPSRRIVVDTATCVVLLERAT